MKHFETLGCLAGGKEKEYDRVFWPPKLETGICHNVVQMSEQMTALGAEKKQKKQKNKYKVIRVIISCCGAQAGFLSVCGNYCFEISVRHNKTAYKHRAESGPLEGHKIGRMPCLHTRMYERCLPTGPF